MLSLCQHTQTGTPTQHGCHRFCEGALGRCWDGSRPCTAGSASPACLSHGNQCQGPRPACQMDHFHRNKPYQIPHALLYVLYGRQVIVHKGGFYSKIDENMSSHDQTSNTAILMTEIPESNLKCANKHASAGPRVKNLHDTCTLLRLVASVQLQEACVLRIRALESHKEILTLQSYQPISFHSGLLMSGGNGVVGKACSLEDE
eukprot:110111-Pelagomonas_calceolata.AAC.1